MPTFEELVNFVREWASIPVRVEITAETLFEEDLGITGDDGCELLEATEDHFCACLSSAEEGYRRTFDLAPHEFLFHCEGPGWGLPDIVSLTSPCVRAFSVGDLFEAVRKAPPKPIQRQSILGL